MPSHSTSRLATSHITSTARDIGSAEFIMFGFRAIGRGDTTIKSGSTDITGCGNKITAFYIRPY
jgi:hypothetical protein